jgi:hypothetical protein
MWLKQERKTKVKRKDGKERKERKQKMIDPDNCSDHSDVTGFAEQLIDVQQGGAEKAVVKLPDATHERKTSLPRDLEGN